MTQKPHSGLEFTQQPSQEQILSAFKVWAMADADPYSDWNIERRTARSLVEQHEVFEENLAAYQRTILDLKEQLQAAQDEAVAQGYAAKVLEEQYESLLSLAEHLFQMIDRETWRATGGDDQQGHYEGDYHAEQIKQRLCSLRASFPASVPEGLGQTTAPRAGERPATSNQESERP